MSKKMEITIDETTGEYQIDMSGYEGEECKKELAQIIAALREEGIEMELGDIKKKPPQTAYRNAQTQKIGGR